MTSNDHTYWRNFTSFYNHMLSSVPERTRQLMKHFVRAGLEQDVSKYISSFKINYYKTCCIKTTMVTFPSVVLKKLIQLVEVEQQFLLLLYVE